MGWFKSFTRALAAASTFGTSEIARAVAPKIGGPGALLVGGALNPTGTLASEVTGATIAPGSSVTAQIQDALAEKGTGGAALPPIGDQYGKTPLLLAAEENLRKRTKTLLTGGQGDTSDAPTYSPMLGGNAGLLGGPKALIGRVRPTRY